MSKKFKMLIGLGVAGLALYFLSRGSASKKLIVNLSGLTFGKGSILSAPPVYLNFSIINPTNTSITVKNITGQVLVNDKYLSDVSSLQNLKIAANAESTMQVTAKISYLSILPFLKDILTKKQKYKVTFKGNVNSSGVLIPIEQTIFQS
jgi:LEA14-like dessication related protein